MWASMLGRMAMAALERRFPSATSMVITCGTEGRGVPSPLPSYDSSHSGRRASSMRESQLQRGESKNPEVAAPPRTGGYAGPWGPLLRFGIGLHRALLMY